MRLFAALGTFLFVERFVPLVNTYERGGIPVVNPLQSILTALPLLVLVALGVRCPPSWQRRLPGAGAALMGASALCLVGSELLGVPGVGGAAAVGTRCAVALLCAGLCRSIAPFGMRVVARNLVAASCVACVAAPVGYGLLAHGWFGAYCAVLVMAAATAWLSQRGLERVARGGGASRAAVSSNELQGETTRGWRRFFGLFASCGLVGMTVTYVVLGAVLGVSRMELARQTASAQLSDVLPLVGMLLGSVALLVCWHARRVLLSEDGLPTALYGAAVTALLLLPAQSVAATSAGLLVACAAYEALRLMFIVAFAETYRAWGLEPLPACSLCLFGYCLFHDMDGLLDLWAAGWCASSQARILAVCLALMAVVALVQLGLRRRPSRVLDGPAGPMAAGSRHDAPRGDSDDGRLVERPRECWGLTPRETDVLALVATARSVPRMAAELYVSENTVKAHMKSIYAKEDVHSKQELLDAMARLG